jgi:hypothetical protein
MTPSADTSRKPPGVPPVSTATTAVAGHGGPASVAVDRAHARADDPPPSPQGRVPDFFIVGHPKCGTTALHAMLRTHPEVYMPSVKEPRYFAPDMYGPARGARRGKLPDTLPAYLELFAPARPDQRAGEASPLYLASRTAAREIAKLQPEARIVAILREPASFLRSMHMQLVESHLEPKNDLASALALEQARRQGKRVPRALKFSPDVLLYSEYVRYTEQVRRYHEAFGRERVKVLVYDDFRADNEATVREVLRFLDVDERAPVAATSANPTVRVRSRALDDAVRAVSLGSGPVSRTAKTIVKAVAPRKVRRAALAATWRGVVYGQPRPPDARLMATLRVRFKGEVVALSEYLERDLVTLWGYDEGG